MSKTQKQSLLQLQSQTLKFGAASKWPVCLILNGRGRGCAGLANAAIVKPNANRCWKLRTSSLPGRVQHINQLPDSSWSCVAMVHASLSTVSLVTRWSVFMVCMYNFLANSLSRPASVVGEISQSLQVAKKCCTTKKMEQNAANAATAGSGKTAHNSLEVLAGYLLQLGIRRQPYGALGALAGILHEQPHPRVGDHLNANGRH